MNTKKLAISLGVVVALFVLVMIAAYFYRLGANKSISQTAAQPEATIVTEKDKIPSCNLHPYFSFGGTQGQVKLFNPKST